MDADLRSGICVDLARELRARGVPTLVFSCYDQNHALPEFRTLPWLSMPAPFTALHAALDLLALRRGKIVMPGDGLTSRPRDKGGGAPRVRSSKAA